MLMSGDESNVTIAARAEAVNSEQDIYQRFENSYSASPKSVSLHRKREKYYDIITNSVAALLITIIFVSFIIVSLSPFNIVNFDRKLVPAIYFLTMVAMVVTITVMSAIKRRGESRDNIDSRSVVCFYLDQAIVAYANDNFTDVWTHLQNLREYSHTTSRYDLSGSNSKVLRDYCDRIYQIDSESNEGSKAELNSTLNETFPLIAHRLIYDLVSVYDELDKFLYDIPQVDDRSEDEEGPSSEPGVLGVFLTDSRELFGLLLTNWYVRSLGTTGIIVVIGTWFFDLGAGILAGVAGLAVTILSGRS